MTDDGAERRAEALRIAATARTTRAVQASESGIRALIKDGGQISFKAVARASGVSTKFLHQHADLAARIRKLRDQQRGATEREHELTVDGESAIIAGLRRQLRDQEDRHKSMVAELRSRLVNQDRQIATLYGRLDAH